MDLSQLRGAINVVLQHPSIIQTDTIRENLDPRSLYSDRELEAALTDSAFNLAKESNDQSQESFDNTIETGRPMV